MSTKGTTAYKEDEEMSMEEILASIRKYVTDEDPYGLNKTSSTPSSQEVSRSSLRQDILELGEIKKAIQAPPLEEDVSSHSTASFHDVYEKTADDQEPFGGSPMTHSYANQSSIPGYGHHPQGQTQAQQPNYYPPSGGGVHSPFGATAAPIYPHQVYGNTPQLHPVTPDTLLHGQQNIPNLPTENYAAMPQPMMTNPHPYGVSHAMEHNAASASGQSLSKLIEAAKITQVHMEKAAAASASSHSLENIALHAMAPQIKAWLDEHLPFVVERLVQKEIERLTKTLLKLP